MATVNLNPNGTVSNQWDVSSGDTVHDALADSDTASYIRDDAQNQTCLVELDNFGATHTSITSIRHYVSGFKFNTRSGDTDIQVKLEAQDGTVYYSENHSLNFNSYIAQDHYGTARTTSDGSTAWTQLRLNNLRLNINTSPEDPDGVSAAQVVKAYVEVTYSTDYGNNVIGIDSGDIAKINGIAIANISKVNDI